jgi:hypothetical protein
MNYGYGSPYVRVFSSRGEISFELKSFTYKYSQEEDDVAQLELLSSEVDLPDRADLQEGSIITITWGYINGPSVTRKVVIRDIKVNFSSEGISLGLVCTDKASLAKVNNSKKVHSYTDLEKLAKELAEKNGLVFKGISRLVDENTLEIDSEKNLVTFNTYFTPSGDIAKGVAPDAVVKIPFKAYVSIPQASRSDFQLLRYMANNEPGGPYEVTGRDEELIVRKRALNLKAKKAFTYKGEPGNLIEFTPESKNLTKKSESVNSIVSGFDPELKAAFEAYANETTTKVPKVGGDIVDSPLNTANFGTTLNRVLTGAAAGAAGGSIFPAVGTATGALTGATVGLIWGLAEEFRDIATSDPSPFTPRDSAQEVVFGATREKVERMLNTRGYVEKLKSDLPKNVEQDTQQVTEYKHEGGVGVTPHGLLPYRVFSTSSPYFFKPDANTSTAVDNTRVVRLIRDTPYDYSSHKVTVESNPKDAQAEAANRQAEAALEKNPASATVVGDISLRSGEVYSFLNVSKKYSGNYYCIECVHTLDNSKGFIITMQLRRNSTGKIPGLTPDKKVVTDINPVIDSPNKQVAPDGEIGIEDLSIVDGSTYKEPIG